MMRRCKLREAWIVREPRASARNEQTPGATWLATISCRWNQFRTNFEIARAVHSVSYESRKPHRFSRWASARRPKKKRHFIAYTKHGANILGQCQYPCTFARCDYDVSRERVSFKPLVWWIDDCRRKSKLQVSVEEDKAKEWDKRIMMKQIRRKDEQVKKKSHFVSWRIIWYNFQWVCYKIAPRRGNSRSNCIYYNISCVYQYLSCVSERYFNRRTGKKHKHAAGNVLPKFSYNHISQVLSRTTCRSLAQLLNPTIFSSSVKILGNLFGKRRTNDEVPGARLFTRHILSFGRISR